MFDVEFFTELIVCSIYLPPVVTLHCPTPKGNSELTTIKSQSWKPQQACSSESNTQIRARHDVPENQQ